MFVYTPGYVNGRDSAWAEKSFLFRFFRRLAGRAWLDLDTVIEYARRNPETPAWMIPVVDGGRGCCYGHFVPGYGFLPYVRGGAITSYDGIINARGSGKADDYVGIKASLTTAANAWSSMYRVAGMPGPGSYANIPGGATHNRASEGAWPLTNPSGSDTKYLLVVGAGWAGSTGVALLVDLLVGAGNISATTTSAQTVNSVALTRYTSGAGVGMIFEVTTALGSTAANISVSYTNHAGTSGRTAGPHALTTSAIVNRLQPTAGGFLTPLQAGDLGVRSVQTVTISASMGGGVLALNLFYPLAFVTVFVSNSFIERDSTLQVDAILPLVVGTDNQLGCLTWYGLTAATSTGAQTYLIRTVAG